MSKLTLLFPDFWSRDTFHGSLFSSFILLSLHTALSLVPCDLNPDTCSEPFIKQPINSSATFLPMALPPATLASPCCSLNNQTGSYPSTSSLLFPLLGIVSPQISPLLLPYFIQVSAQGHIIREIFLDHAIQIRIPHVSQDLAFTFFIAFVPSYVTSLLQL